MTSYTSVVRVLGCSGGIGIPGEGTTSFMIDEDILIDAGTGVTHLTVDEMSRINHVVISHSHLDHVCCLPLLIDSVNKFKEQPLLVYGLAGTIEALKKHIFNGVIWPDFSRIPSVDKPSLRFVEIHSGQVLQFGDRQITPLEVIHSVPSLGVVLNTPTGAWAFSGDTHKTDAFYAHLNGLPNLKYVCVEAAFPEEEKWLADLSYHLCPSMVAEELNKLTVNPIICLTHLKPNEKETIEREIQHELEGRQFEFMAFNTRFLI